MRLFAAFISLFLAVGYCASAAGETATAEVIRTADPEAAVVTINGTVIKEKEVAAETAKQLVVQTRQMPPGMELNDWIRNQIRIAVVDMLVDKTLIEKKMTAQKITITEEQVIAEIENIAKQQNLAVEDIPAEIAKLGLTMDDLKGQIKMKVQMDTLIEKEMKDKDVKDEEVKAFYDDNPQYFDRPEQVRAAHVLVLTQNKSDEEKAAAKTKIEDILKKAKAGEDFAALAKEHSEDPGSKDRGGEYTFTRGEMVPEFEEAAFKLKDGEISGIVETDYGYHVLKKLEHLKAGKVPFDEVTKKIKEFLTQQKRSTFWEGYSKKMHDEAKIEYSEAEKKLREEAALPMMQQMPPQ